MTGGDRPAGAVIEVWQAPDHRWRWRYLEPSGDGQTRAFLGNKEYETREVALRSATTAYPGVAVREPGPAPGQTPARPGSGRLPRLGYRGSVVLLGLAALAVLLLRSRRRRPVATPGRPGRAPASARVRRPPAEG